MIRSFLLAGALAVGLSACDFAALDSVTDDLNVILSLDRQSTVVGGLAVDAATGEPVGRELTLRYTSPTAGAVVDAFGDPVDGATVRGGAFNFAIAEAAAPSAAAPVEVTVEFTAPGYLPQRRMIAVADTGRYDMVVEMISRQAPPAGVATARTVGATSGASGTAAPIVATAAEGDRSARVDVAAGTVFEGADGQPLSGDLRIEVTDIDPTSDAFRALPAIPAGRAAVAAIAAEATVGGEAARSRTETQMTAVIPDLDPATGQPFAPGATLRVSAYDAATGAFVDLGEATVEATADNGRVRSGTVQIGFYFYFTGIPPIWITQDVPAADLTIRLERNGQQGPVTVHWDDSGYSTSATIAPGATQGTIRGPADPAARTLYILGSGWYATPNGGSACTDCVFSLPAPEGSVRVTLRPVCSDPGKRVYLTDLPTVTLHAKAAGGNWFSVSDGPSVQRRADGSIESATIVTSSLRAGGTYAVRGTYLDQQVTTTLSVSSSGEASETLDAPGSICQ